MDNNKSDFHTLGENPEVNNEEIKLNNDINTEETAEYIPSMDEFEEELFKSFKKLYVGDIVEGTVISITDTELLINFGYMSDGVVPVTETLADEEEDIHHLYHEGQTIKAEIIKTDDGDGNVLLSILKAEEVLVWDELEAAFNTAALIDVKVKEPVKGGVVCIIKGVRAFIPASQLSTRYVEDLTEYVGSLLKVKVIDFNREDKRVILSRKEVEAQEQAAKKSMLMDTVKKGDRYQGTVVNIKDFGAFVDIGGVQGLIHKQDLSWEKVKHPSDILQIGDQVDVYVIDIDHKNEKISFGLKDIKEDPWANAINDYQVGQILSGEVVRIASYGAFVSLGNGIEGLVHISEMSEKRIARPQEVTAVGDKVKVKIINIDKEAKRIQLSMKSVEEDIDQEQLKDFQSTEEATTSLEDVFKVFLKDINN